MPTRFQHMFQPAPVPPQLPPDSHLFAVAPAVGGPWSTAAGAVKVPSPAVNCVGAPPGPGDCYLITFDQGPTDAYLRATATATVNGLVYASDSVPIALPETNASFVVLMIFFLLIMALNAE